MLLRTKIPTVGVVIISGVLAFGGEISELYLKSHVGRLPDQGNSRSHEEVGATNHGITEIGIERTRCFGTCPAYTFIARSDGTFRYQGDQFVERLGEFTGKISGWQFNQLAQFIRDSGYMEMDDSYSRLVTDNPTVYSMVVMNGKRKIISNYANAAPNKLWAIEQLMDGLMAKAQWDAKK